MEICIIRSATAKCSQFLFLPFTVQTRLTPILIIKDLPNPLFLLFFFSFFKTKTRSRKANTHKDNNEIPLRAKEVLPGNRKDFSTCQRTPLSRSESGSFFVIWTKPSENEGENGVFPTPYRQLFEIHGSKFKPDPSCDGSQASVVRVTHRVSFLRVRKDPFNRFLALCVNCFRTIRFSYLLH